MPPVESGSRKRSTRSCTCGDNLKTAKPPATPSPPTATTQNQCSPARKKSEVHTTATSIVWPKSGSRMSGAMVSGSSRKDSNFAGSAVGPLRPPSVKAQAARTTKAGLMNSEGCRPKIQRRAPLTSAPYMSARRMSRNDTTNSSNAARRTWRGVRNEVAIINAAVGISMRACRSTKWKVERLSRSATAGLAASAITRPITISAPKEPRSQRSTVRIQSARGPRSALETMGSGSPLHRRLRHVDVLPEKLTDEDAERVSARLEIGELVERGAGRRQKHDRLLRLGSDGVARRGGGGGFEGAAAFEGNRAVQGAREFFRRLADQIDFGDAPEQRAEGLDAARFRLSTANPVDVVEGQKRLFGRVGVGRLRIVDEQHAAQPADLLHAVREAGERLEPARDVMPRDAERAGGGGREGGVLSVMGAAQRARPVEACQRFGAAARNEAAA